MLWPMAMFQRVGCFCDLMLAKVEAIFLAMEFSRFRKICKKLLLKEMQRLVSMHYVGILVMIIG
jgi:hypothetical protein